MSDKMKKIIFKKIWICLIVIIIIVIGMNVYGKSTSSFNENKSNTSNNSIQKLRQSATLKQRQIAGKAMDLGAGTFFGGKNIQAGLYDITPVDGRGNCTIEDNKGKVNISETLGMDRGMCVTKIRTKITNEDRIQLYGINKVHFEPVVSSSDTTSQSIQLYTGTWAVGEDIAKGTYIATSSKGSGNLAVYNKDGMTKVNKILGTDGVKEVTVDLEDYNTIVISNLNQVTLTPTN
ncbi:hypothetical protein [Clostridium pasteurianum]|uniref:Uncharacterized protein n=1 Tax=Clostridium pasteurianum BC1 TaxID=86416 RepID=R4KEA2_CLOPA|nr:hypothetical protein [Clostridium pasteurianum]AGK97945.1 hypothetical protein Clopa_3130 [Clostridium pasteurianum BC1]